MKSSKTYLFFTRAQPIHKGHEEILQEMFFDALTHSELHKDKKVNVIVMLGSCDDIDSIRNPLSTEFRSELVLTVCKNIVSKLVETMFDELDTSNFSFNIIELFDSPYNYDLWVENAQRKLFSAVESDTEIVIYGQEGVEQYARDFDGKVHRVSTKLIGEQEIHATKVREMIFNSNLEEARKSVPDCLSDEQFQKIVDEVQKSMAVAKDYADSTGNKYNSCFMAVDNLVQYGGKILFIRRKDNGKLALPGGFAEPSWTMIQNAKRELIEETSVDVDKCNAVLREQKVFDTPFRGPRASNRVNIYTTVFHWVFDKKPEVVYGDDAAFAEWLRFDEIEDKAPSEFHGDHKKLVCNMLKLNYFCNKVE